MKITAIQTFQRPPLAPVFRFRADPASSLILQNSGDRILRV